MRPAEQPIGLRLNQAARAVSRAFDEALAAAGGSIAIWQVLLTLKSRPGASQRDLSEAMGIREATLTTHLNGMESAGLLSRRRQPGNRRVHVVEVSAAGDEAFLRLRQAAAAFDRRLRAGLAEAEIDELRRLLDRLVGNVAAERATMRRLNADRPPPPAASRPA